MHNYEKVIKQMFESGKFSAGQLTSVDCLHDDWCQIHKGGECNCNVEVIVKPIPPAHTKKGIKGMKGIKQ